MASLRPLDHTLRLLLVASLLLTVAAPVATLAQPLETTRTRTLALWSSREDDASYPARLEAIRQLARRFPGRIAPVGHELREMGLFAGIFIQTSWQNESGRDDLPIWFLVNRNLTLVPRILMDEYLADPNLAHAQSPWVLAQAATQGLPEAGNAAARALHQGPLWLAQPAGSGGAATGAVDVCRAWKDYFRINDEAARLVASPRWHERLRGEVMQRTEVNRKLWRAHTTGIKGALWQHRDALAALDLPEDELDFWQGWIRVVFASEALSPSTTDLLLGPTLRLTMPPCSPLGADHCRVATQTPARRAFIKFIRTGNLDHGDFVALFGPRPGFAALARWDALRTFLTGGRAHTLLDADTRRLLDGLAARRRLLHPRP